DDMPSEAKPIPVVLAGLQLQASKVRKDRGEGVVKLAVHPLAARVADRIERIDELLTGDAKAWARVGIPRLDTDGGRIVVEVRVDDLVKEERQQTTLLRNLLAEIHRQRSGQPPDPPDPSKEDDDLEID
ncbi:hypothetical protein NLX62_03180, partial [Mycobacteriaceae bacterium Msp059]|nr:hypothetical protein [Mycobacteriaceae bacterium Msp059]